MFVKKINEYSYTLMFKISDILSHPIWFFGTIICTWGWMALNTLLPHPVDDPKSSFPITVLGYTLTSLWIENAMKVSQAVQQQQAQKQMDRIEVVAASTEEIAEETKAQTVMIVQMLEDNKTHDELLTSTVHTLKDAVENLYIVVEKLIHKDVTR